jgi:hypothetical protein
MPILAQARVNNPNLYDAALAAAVATSLEAFEGGGNEHSGEIILPGQSPGASIAPPAWNLM